MENTWEILGKGGISAFMCYNMYSKISNTVVKRKRLLLKATPLVANLINRGENLRKLAAINWVNGNEGKGLKNIYPKNIWKQENIKLSPCGLYIDKPRPFIAASSDNFMHCKCHGQSVVEIKCSHVVRSKTPCDEFNECFSKTKTNDKITLKKTQKYYTQIITQITLKGSISV